MSKLATAAPFPTPEQRLDLLATKRLNKMARSAHAFVRGSTKQFYDWLSELSLGTVPDAPSIWICGDCHVGNLGPLANAEGKVRIQIRDLDQTVISNPAWDLIRLGLSMTAAARSSNLPGITSAHLLEELVRGYQDALAGHEDADAEAQAGSAVRTVIRQATQRKWTHLARERLEQVEPKIPLGKRFWPLAPDETAAIKALVTDETTIGLIHDIHGRGDHHKVEVCDAAYWIKGCSSLGTLRYAVLVGIGHRSERTYLLVDIKEAVPTVATAAPGSVVPGDDARRVVTGARAISPFLGDRMAPASLLGRSVVLRELMPQDLKLELDQLTTGEAISASRYLAAVVGHSHARQMSGDVRAAWSRELDRHHARDLDAPSWLWSTIVDLVGRHERAYLDHCRRHGGMAA